MKFEVYILKLANGQYYIGCTNDLARRLMEHKSGRTTSIKHKLPCKLVYSMELTSNVKARRAEAFIKRQKSKKFIERLISGEIDLNTILGQGL